MEDMKKQGEMGKESRWKNKVISILIVMAGFLLVNSAFSAVYSASKISVNSFISGIEITGNKNIPKEKIYEAIFSKLGDAITQEKINNDVKGIYSLGFFENVESSFEKTKAGTRIIYKVKENPLINQIVFEGNSIYSSSKLQDIISSKKGMILSFKSLQDDIKTIDDLYHKDGYLLEKVIDVSTDTIEAIIKIKILEGMIEDIEISGNEITKDYVILREMKSMAGRVLSEKILTKDLRRIFNLGFFSEVTPNFEPGSSPDKIILEIKVKENKTNTINFGGGYGEREGWFGFVDLSADNLFGRGHSALLRGQTGQQQSTYQLRYTYPWIFTEQLGDRVSATFKRWVTQGKNIYLLETAEREGHYNGWDISLNKPFSDEWGSSLSFGSETVKPTGTASFEPYDSNTIGLSLSYDTRDNWMNPSTGRYYIAGIRQGWKKTASSASDFQKYSIELNQYSKVIERATLAGHLGIGIGVRDVPIGEIYFVGGSNTIRGYEPSQSQAQNGKRRLLSNFEFRYNFNEMFQGVVFYDWGGAWDSGLPQLEKFISGRGFGIRFNTPMGPIRLDYGIGQNKSFSEGIVHFSIGQAF